MPQNSPSAPATGEARPDYQVVDISGLRVGSRLRMPIQDERSVLLLAEGQIITERFLENLAARNLNQVQVHASEMARIYAGRPQGTSEAILPAHTAVAALEHNDLTDELDDYLSRSSTMAMPVQGEAFAETLEKPVAESYDHQVRDEFVERTNQSVDQIGEVFDRLMRGEGLDVDSLSTITDEALSDLQKDMDLFACLGVNPLGTNFPGRHSVHTCMLSISIGTQLKLDRPTLKELAIGCLIHDAGMLMIDKGSFEANRRLSEVEFLEITKHPVRIFDRMKEMRAIPTRSAFVAYQIHERPDGLGYPRRRQSNQIHFLSRVAAVADVYVALVSPRPYREAILPHAAMQAIQQAGRKGRLDPEATDALFRTLSAYPLGSYVQLNDGRVGQVIRSNGSAFERPVVEAWYAHRLTAKPDVVDLSVDQSISILGPLASLTSKFQDPSKRGGSQTIVTPADPFAADRAERRTRPRRAFASEVNLYVSHSRPPSDIKWRLMRANSIDFSIGGLRIHASREIPGNDILVEMELGPGLRACIRCRIVHKRKLDNRTWEYGVQFVERLPAPPRASEVIRV